MKDHIRVLHGADFHLDSPFEGLTEEKAALRRREQRQLLRDIAAIAREREAELVLLAGDLLDTGSAYRETALGLCEALGEMKVPVFISPGNHDFYAPNSPWARLELPENVHVFRQNAIRGVCLEALNAQVFGAAFTEESCPPLLRDFAPPPREGDALRLLCLHGELGSGQGKYCPITREEISRSGMDYVALGHSHTGSGMQRAGNVSYAWPGCPEGRGFDETGEKGVLLVDVSREGCTGEFIPTARRHYHREEVDLTGGIDPERGILALLEGAPEGDCWRITLTGETAVAPETERLRQRLAQRVFALRLRDKTRPERDVWAALEEDSLRGCFLRRLRQRLDAAAEERSRETLYLALRFALAAMEGGEEPRG